MYTHSLSCIFNNAGNDTIDDAYMIVLASEKPFNIEEVKHSTAAAIQDALTNLAAVNPTTITEHIKDYIVDMYDYEGVVVRADAHCCITKGKMGGGDSNDSLRGIFERTKRNCLYYERNGERMSLMNEIGVLRGVAYCMEQASICPHDEEFLRLIALQQEMKAEEDECDGP